MISNDMDEGGRGLFGDSNVAFPLSD